MSSTKISYVKKYINTSKKIKFIDNLDMKKVREFENQYNVSKNQEFYFEYDKYYKVDFEEKKMEDYFSDNTDYEYSSSSSDEDDFDNY